MSDSETPRDRSFGKTVAEEVQWSTLIEMNKRQKEHITRLIQGLNDMVGSCEEAARALIILGATKRGLAIRDTYEEVVRRVSGEAGSSEDQASAGKSVPAKPDGEGSPGGG